MKDEGGRLRGYGYADFEDRDSLVRKLSSVIDFKVRNLTESDKDESALKTDCYPDRRPFNDWLGSEQPEDEDRPCQPGSKKTLSDFDVISWTSMLWISCFVSNQAGKGSGGAGGGFGDREGRGRREEDPDAGRSAFQIF